MTSTHVYIGASLDGFIARSNGDIDWLIKFADQGAVDAYNEFMSGIDCIVIGRGTLDKVLEFSSWPYDRPVFVLSRSLNELPPTLAGKAELVSMKPNDLIDHLAKQGFEAAYIDGGKVIQSFLASDLIDELIVARLPVLLGNGIPLFGELDRDLRFSHVRTRAYPNGIVRSYYTRAERGEISAAGENT